MANPPYSVLYMRKDIPGKGRGLVAKRTLEPGTSLFYDNVPLFWLNPPLDIEEVRWRDKLVALRSLDNRAWPETTWSLAFRDLHNAFPGRAERPELGTYRTNRVPACGETESVWRLVSLLNHSCAPNAFYGSWGMGHAEVHIIKRVAPGEEITRSYTSTIGGKRRQELAEIFGFVCVCSVCKPVPNGFVSPVFGPVSRRRLVPDDEDALYRELFEIVSGLIVKTKELELPHQTMFLAGLGSTLLDRLGIVDDRLTGMIEMAFIVAVTQKDMARAKTFAKLVLQRQQICVGKYRRPEIKRAQRMVDFPEEFAGRYSSNNWDVPKDDRPRQNTIFERHMWLWRVDYPHDTTSLASLASLTGLVLLIPRGLRIIAASAPIARGRWTPDEKARVESFRI
ncbi:hypothetical protein IFR05_002070 [Cadophora sp. M221]|nr:hypothetical protein IFR05_002070 [Cadophora sp. M221]